MESHFSGYSDGAARHGYQCRCVPSDNFPMSSQPQVNHFSESVKQQINGQLVEVYLTGDYPARLRLHDEGDIHYSINFSSVPEDTECNVRFDAPGLSVFPNKSGPQILEAHPKPPTSDDSRKQFGVPVQILFGDYVISSSTPGFRHLDVVFTCTNGISVVSSQNLQVYEEKGWVETITPLAELAGVPALIALFITELLRRRSEKQS
jgi:hypothetical protein